MTNVEIIDLKDKVVVRDWSNTTYKKEYDEKAELLAKIGATQREMAKIFGVTPETISIWKVRHKSFADAISQGYEGQIERVEETLYNKAVGYTKSEKHLVKVKNELGMEEIKVIDIEKEVDPDQKSIAFWLTNMKRDKWSNRESKETLGADGLPIDPPTVIEIIAATPKDKEDEEE